MSARKKSSFNISLDNIKLKDVKPLVGPLGSIFGILILGVISYKIISNQIQILKTKVTAAEKTTNILQDKVDTLSEFRKIVTNETVNSLNAALPETNSALLMLSHVKTLAQKHSLVFSNLDVTTPSQEENLFKVELKFDLDGSFEQVISFLRDLKFYAPINNVQDVEFVSGTDISRSTVSVVVYFAEYPSKLPALTEPITNLTPNEMEILRTLEGLIIPDFVDLEATQPNLRGSPFE